VKKIGRTSWFIRWTASRAKTLPEPSATTSALRIRKDDVQPGSLQERRDGEKKRWEASLPVEEAGGLRTKSPWTADPGEGSEVPAVRDFHRVENSTKTAFIASATRPAAGSLRHHSRPHGGAATAGAGRAVTLPLLHARHSFGSVNGKMTVSRETSRDTVHVR